MEPLSAAPTENGREHNRLKMTRRLVAFLKSAWMQVLGTDDLLNVDSMVQRHFSVDEAKAAREVFLAGSSLPIMPVVVWDDVSIGDGVPGRGVLSLKALMLNHMNPANNQGQHVEVPYGWLTGAE